MLSGVRIVEFEALGPAPFAGAMLAELGAEVLSFIARMACNRPRAQGTAHWIVGKNQSFWI